MADDAIERVRAEALLRKFGDGMPWTRGQGRDTWAAAIDAMIAFASQQAPEGWVLVPREPTTEMLSAAFTPWMHDSEQEVMCENIWSAMLDAAPSVTLGEVG